MRIALVCLLVVASVTALEQPASAQFQSPEKRAAFPKAGAPPPPPPQSPPAGYPAPGVATLPQGQGAAFPEASLVSEAQQQAISKAVFLNQQAAISKTAFISQQPAEALPPTPPPSAGGLSSEALERIEQKSNIVEQTSNTIDEHVEIPIPTPYPATFDYKIPKSFAVSAPQAVQFQAPQTYSLPQPSTYAAPQQYSVPIPLSFSSPTYSVAPQFPATPAPFLSQYSFANTQQFNLPSAPVQTQLKTVIPSPAPLVKKPQPQLKTVPAPTPAISVKTSAPAPQPLQFNSPALTPQIFYNGAPSNYVNLPTVYSTAKPVIAGPAVSHHIVHQPAFNLAQPFSLPQPAFSLAQPAFNLAQPAFNLAQPAFNLAQPAFNLAQPAFSYPQPAISLQQPLFSAKQLNVELSPLSPTTVAPISFEASPTPLPLTINTATPAPLHIAHSIVTSTPSPITFSTVHSYDGPSHAYLPPENFLKKK